MRLRLKYNYLYESQVINEITNIALETVTGAIIKYFHTIQTEILRDKYTTVTGTILWNNAIDSWINTMWALYETIQTQVGIEWKKSTGGTFPKRLSSYVYKTFNVKLPVQLLKEIGTIASANNVTSDNTLFWDIFKCDTGDWWNDGDFGDVGSCLWNSNENARFIMEQKDFYAIRVYDSDKLERERFNNGMDTIQLSYKDLAEDNLSALYRSGRGRAWMYYIPNYDAYVIWNGYDSMGTLQALHFARIFATHFGYVYHKIRLANQERGDGQMYINGNQGWLVYKSINTKAESLRHYDFHLQIDDDDDERECVSCQDHIQADNTYDTVDGVVCRLCQDEFYVPSEWSGDYIRSDNAIYVEDECDQAITCSSIEHWYGGWYEDYKFGDYAVWIASESVYIWKINAYLYSDGDWYRDPEEDDTEETDENDDTILVEAGRGVIVNTYSPAPEKIVTTTSLASDTTHWQVYLEDNQ